jgi:nucleotide-binding universal stress UspA family protein
MGRARTIAMVRPVVRALKHLVVNLELDVFGARALAAAIDVARRRGNMRVHALHVRAASPTSETASAPASTPSDSMLACRARVDGMIARCFGDHPGGIVDLLTSVRCGAAMDVVAERARSLRAALIFVGQLGPRRLVKRLSLEASQHVVPHAPCPVVVVSSTQADANELGSAWPLTP